MILNTHHHKFGSWNIVKIQQYRSTTDPNLVLKKLNLGGFLIASFISFLKTDFVGGGNRELKFSNDTKITVIGPLCKDIALKASKKIRAGSNFVL